jgi:hypothetical protein
MKQCDGELSNSSILCVDGNSISLYYVEVRSSISSVVYFIRSY